MLVVLAMARFFARRGGEDFRGGFGMVIGLLFFLASIAAVIYGLWLLRRLTVHTGRIADALATAPPPAPPPPAPPPATGDGG